MKWVPTLLCCTFLFSGAASAGTVSSVKASVPSVAVGAPVSVTVSGTSPCGAVHINYGDGIAITYATSTLPVTQTHVFQKPGTFAIVARGMGNCNGEATTKVEVTGQAPPPAGSEITGITFAPNPGVVRQQVAVNIAGRGLCAFVISFGDGNQQEVSAALPQRINHTYALVQTYTVIVAPAAPCSGKFTERLPVAARGGERITRLTINPRPGVVGRGVLFVVDGVGTCSYRIDYGDGNREERSKPLPDRLSHVYNTPGSYIIAVEPAGTCEGRPQREALDVR
jgi:hypothetical protein